MICYSEVVNWNELYISENVQCALCQYFDNESHVYIQLEFLKIHLLISGMRGICWLNGACLNVMCYFQLLTMIWRFNDFTRHSLISAIIYLFSLCGPHSQPINFHSSRVLSTYTQSLVMLTAPNNVSYINQYINFIFSLSLYIFSKTFLHSPSLSAPCPNPLLCVPNTEACPTLASYLTLLFHMTPVLSGRPLPPAMYHMFRKPFHLAGRSMP